MSLTLSYHDKTAVLTMDDGKVNALDNDWFRAMLAHLDEIEASDATGLILQGREGIFSGGLNIKWLPTMDRKQQVEFGQLFPGTLNRLYQFPKPTIAARTGHAIAGGCLLACACDTRLAVKGDFNMAMNEVLINMTIPEWAINIIQDVVPKPHAATMLNLAQFMSLEEAESMAVITERYDDKESLLANALARAEGYNKFSMKDFAATKLKVRKL